MKSIVVCLVSIFASSVQLLGQNNPEPAKKFILPKEASGDDYVANVVIVKFRTINPEGKISMESTEMENLKRGMKLATIQQVRQLFPPTRRNPTDNQFGLMRIVEIKYSSTANIEQVLNEILENEAIEYAEPSYNDKFDQYVSDVSGASTNTASQLSINDPAFKKGKQDYLKQVHAPEAWNVPVKSATGSATPVIAVIDSGSDFNHEDLANNIYYNEADPIDGIDNDGDGYIDNYRGWDFADHDNDPHVAPLGNPHGIHVSGLASAVTNNAKGMASIANNHAKLLILKISSDSEELNRSKSVVVGGYEAIKYAADHDANVINCSWGHLFFSSYHQDVVNYAVSQGCLIVAAAGNEGRDKNIIRYPAAYKGVFAVSSVDALDKKSDFSSYGRHVSISAPGSEIYSTVYGNKYAKEDGTSMASPVVASAAAYVKAYFPSLTMEQVGNLLRKYADPVDHLNAEYKGKLGAGRLNVYRALTEKGIPNIIVESNSPVLSGEVLALSATRIEGEATYYWEGPDGLTKTTKVPHLERIDAQPNISGTYKLTVKEDHLSGVIEYPPAFVDVAVLDYAVTPTIESNSPVERPIYVGEELMLSTIIGIKGSVSYHWVSPDGLSRTTRVPYIKYTSASGALSGTHIVTISVNGHTFPVASTPVGVVNSARPIKLVSNSPLCVSNTLQLLVSNPITETTSSNAKSYHWEFPDGLSATTFVPKLERKDMSVAMTGTYTVTISVNGHTFPPASTKVEFIDPHKPIVVYSNSPVCPGNLLELVAVPVVGATSYHWQFPNGLSETTDSSLLTRDHADVTMSGTYTLTVSMDGCVPPPPVSVVVVVDAHPKAPTVYSNSPVCPGNVLYLSASYISGASYHWQFPNGLSETTDSPHLTRDHADVTMSGTYTLTVSVDGCVSPPPVSIDVVVGVKKPKLNSNLLVCAGSLLVLSTDNMGGNARYKWEGPNGFSNTTYWPSLERYPADATMSGSYTLTVLVDGCESPPASVSVRVTDPPQEPTINESNSSICVGNLLTLSTARIEGASYHWEFPDGLSETTSEPKLERLHVNAGMSGWYKLTVIVNGCQSRQGWGHVGIADRPQVPKLTSNSPVDVGRTLILSANHTGYGTYRWEGPNGFSYTTNRPSLERYGANAAMSGAYTLTIVSSYGDCESPPASINVVVHPSARNQNVYVNQAHNYIEDRESYYLHLEDPYPNPAGGEMHIPFTIPSAGNVSLKIYSLSTGLLVKEVKDYYSQEGHYLMRVDVSNFRYDDRSLYFYRLQHNDVLYPTAKQFSVLGL